MIRVRLSGIFIFCIQISSGHGGIASLPPRLTRAKATLR